MPQTSETECDRELILLLTRGLEVQASDLHLVAGYPPTLRIHGRLEPIGDALLTGEQIARMAGSVVPPPLKAAHEASKDLDFSLILSLDGQPARFRVNLFQSRGAQGVCFRFIPAVIPSFDWMGVPLDLAGRIAALPNGLVLVTGVTGAGKTTTLAGLVKLVNESGHRRIVTIEEPIEYLFEPAPNSVITQREVGIDVASFADGLRSSLRQDPDVILCGEIRDKDTAQMAISAAETGHLVMSTLHTRDAKGAITRLIDIFPVDQHQDVRGQLSLSLRFIISQHLLPNVVPTEKRVLALEILVANDAVRSAIRLNKLESIDTLIQTGKKFGMQPLEDHLATLVFKRKITPEVAYRFAKTPENLRSMGVPAPQETDAMNGIRE